MENLLARCSILAIIGGGFVATGDVADVVSRGRHLVEAVDVPRAPTDPAAVPAVAPAPPVAAPRITPPPHQTPAPAASPLPVAAPPDEGRQPVDHRPPTTGPDRIEVSGLRAGNRVTVWLRTTAIGAPMQIVCDVIDPTAGEVLVYGGTAGPPARGMILTGTGRPSGSLVRGAAVRLQRMGPGGSPTTDVLAEGTIVALALGN